MALRLNWLFPQPAGCAFCSRPAASPVRDVTGRVPLCAECRDEIGWIMEPCCDRCGRQLEKRAAGPVNEPLCRDCVRLGSVAPVKNRAVVQYTPLAREIVGLFKYRGRETLAIACGKLMADTVRREYRDEAISAVTYVPLHARREAERGFNQAELLANVIARELRWPVYHLLVREKDTPKQSKQSRYDRLTSMEGAFKIRSDEKRNFCCRGALLIVDDVYTTGTTLRACAGELMRAGVPRILAVTFAR